MIVSTTISRIARQCNDGWLVDAPLEQYCTDKHMNIKQFWLTVTHTRRKT